MDIVLQHMKFILMSIIFLIYIRYTLKTPVFKLCIQIRWSENDLVLYALRSLTIEIKESDAYWKILARCPNLIRLQITCENNYHCQLEKNPSPHLNLRRLIIDRSDSDLSEETLEFMLSIVPNLTYLKTIYRAIDMQYDTLANLLTRYTIHLKVIEITIARFIGNETYDLSHIKQAHPLFCHIEWGRRGCSRARSRMIISSK